MSKGKIGRLSILQRWAISLVLSLLPFTATVAYAIWTIDSQSRSQYRSTQEVLALKQASYQLSEQLNGLERTARQYVVLKDEKILQLLNTRLTAFVETQNRLLANPLIEPKVKVSMTQLLTYLNQQLRAMTENSHSALSENSNNNQQVKTNGKNGEPSNSKQNNKNKSASETENKTNEKAIADSKLSTHKSFIENKDRSGNKDPVSGNNDRVSGNKGSASNTESQRSNVSESANTKTSLNEQTKQTPSVEALFKDYFKKLAVIDVLVQDTITNHLQQTERHLKDAEQLILLLGGLIIPLSILLFMISSRTIIRPIHALSNAINQLGRGRWQQSINIEGPIDLMVLGQRLEWMRRKLNSTDRQKQLFLQHVTHELKTPLSAIIEAASLLSDGVPGEINERQSKVLSILMNNTETLNTLIQQLLNYNAVVTKHPVQFTETNINQLTDKVVSQLSFERKTVTWNLPSEQTTVLTDQQRIEMVLKNLLSNAVYYSGNDVTIDIKVEINASSWCLIVEDNGFGIEEDEVKQIFEPFFQGRSKRTGPIKGTGIGLAIVKECVNSLHGKISVDSKPGQGTRFELTFPEKGSYI
ncbi:sensor histidine kinase [Pleionea mediterranea]|uniref:histidine kinase n=1 Tax=Pleionea mediterranea TaxID=523701 RepID=A0A316FVB2_9GAMM|nr:HAMP domain-containing sensor histidine kinase [Pleionea mediterranea]PWK45341.1 signal transduction histidine kinase [Pleionea mediterranea]